MINKAYAFPLKQQGCCINHFNSASGIKSNFQLDQQLILKITFGECKELAIAHGNPAF